MNAAKAFLLGDQMSKSESKSDRHLKIGMALESLREAVDELLASDLIGLKGLMLDATRDDALNAIDSLRDLVENLGDAE